MQKTGFQKNWQYYRFCLYGFLKNLRFFEPFLMLFLLQKLPGNYFQVMLLYSIKLTFRAILEIPSGIIADALGRKGSLIFSYALYVTSFVAYFFAEDFPTLIIPSAIFGIADAFRTGTHKAMIVDYLRQQNWQQHKTEYYGHTRSWSQLGSALSAIIASILTIITGKLDFIFLLTAFPYLVGTVLLMSYPKELNGSFDSQQGKKGNLRKASIESWQQLLNLKNIRRLTSISYFEGYHSALKDFVQPIIGLSMLTLPIVYLSAENKTALMLGIIYFVLHLLSAFGSRMANSFSNALKSPDIAINRIAIFGSITGIGIGVLLYFNLPLVSGILFIPLYVLLNIQRPFVMTFASEQYDSRLMATVLSIESQLGSIVGAAIALLAGFLAQNIGLAHAILIISVISLLFALFNKVKYERKN